MNDDIDIEEFAPWLVIVLALLGGGLRVLLLAQKGLWLDETFSVWVANQRVADLLHWVSRIDQHPPLYYLLLHSWIALRNDTPYEVRLLSVLFGVAAIPVIYLIGKRMAGAALGLTAAALLALSLFNIYYAQEARMYTLLTFNVAVAIYALVRLLTDARAADPIGGQFAATLRAWRTPGPAEPDTPGALRPLDAACNPTGGRAGRLRAVETDLAWVTFIAFSAATLLSHNTAVFFVLAANVFVLGLMLYPRLRPAAPPPAFAAPAPGNWVKAQVGIFLLWSPFLPVFLRQVARVDREFWIPPPDWETVTQTLRTLLNPSAPTQAGAVMLGILCVMLALGLVYFRKRLSIFFFLATLFAVPFLGELLVSLRRPIFAGRTLLWLTLPLFLLLAAGILQLRFRFLVVVALLVIGANSLFATGDYYRFGQKEDWGTAAGYVANFAEKGDLVLFNSNFVEIPFDYYFKPFEEQYGIEVEKTGVPADLFADEILEPKMTPDDVPGLLALVRGRDRVWLVYSHDAYTDPDGLVPQTLASQMKLLREREFYGGVVQLYGVP